MTVKIAVRALLYNKSAASGLIGQIFRENKNKELMFFNRITVPIIDYGSNYTQTINELSSAEPGDYYLQLLLPDGNVLSKKFTIEKNKAAQIIIDLPHEGPHEWTALHALTGQFKQESRQTDNFSRALSSNPKSYSELSKTPEKGYSLSLLSPVENDEQTIFYRKKIVSNVADLINNNDVSSTLNPFDFSNMLYPSLEGPDFALFRLSHSGALVADQEPEGYDFYRGSNISRHFILQQSVSGVILNCLPTPWTSPDSPGGQVEVELLFKKNNWDNRPEMIMTISDPMINTVLGYINAGAIHQAAELVDVELAKSMLFGKVSYPFVATVGGYLLVFGMDRNRYRSSSQDWKSWINNLDLWFDWLPDGAILNAALYYTLGESNRDRAYSALIRAYERGLPFFTFGLKLMIDGFRYFAREDDAKARECLNVLETIANQTDPSQPFLSITLSQHW